MSFPKFHGIALALNSWIANATVENLAADPAPLGAGRIWYNTVTKSLKFSSLDAGGAVIVEVLATGAQVAQVVSDLAALGTRVTDVETNYIKKDGSVAFTGNVDAGGNKLTNVANGTANSDVVNFGQLQSAVATLGNAFKYRTTVNGGADTASALNLETLTNKATGDYYKVSGAGYFKVGPAGTPFFANQNDGLVFNDTAGVDVIDNTDSTVAGTANFVTVTGSTDTGYTVDIATAFKDRVSTLETGLAAEISRAQAAESGLADDIADEAAARATAIGVVTQAIDDEVDRATAAEGVLSGQISGEVSRATAAEGVLSGKIGDLSTLSTSAKSSVVASINEVVASAAGAGALIGDLSTLTTTDKSTVVAAINEVDADLAAEISRATAAEGAIASDLSDEVDRATAAEGTLTTNLAAEVSRATGAEGTIASNLASEISRATGVEGSLASLTTTVKTTLVAAINEVDANADAAAAAAAAASSAVAAEQARAEGIEGGLRTDVDAAAAAVAAETSRAQTVEGILAALTTDAKTSLVNAINEVDAHADTNATAIAAETSRAQGVEGTLASLTTTVKTSLVAAINEVDANTDAEVARATAAEGAIDTKIGSLASLTTTDKTSIVNAINEVASAAGEGTGALKADINAQRYVNTAATAALTHTFTHNLNTQYLVAAVWVKGDDDVFRNDIVAVEETSANVLTVTLTESRIVKVALQALDELE